MAKKSLVWIEQLEERSARISRWKETLAVFHFEIVYTKGTNLYDDRRRRNRDSKSQVNETLAQLKRTYYWNDMQRTIGQTIEDCNGNRYESHPAIVPQQLTETIPLEAVQADIWFWGGMKILTMLDMVTKFLFAKCPMAKPVKEGILEFCGTIEIPKTLTTDSGAEFVNRLVRGIIDELNIQTHRTTAGYHQSHGVIERVPSAMAEHMRIRDTGKNIRGPEAVRAEGFRKRAPEVTSRDMTWKHAEKITLPSLGPVAVSLATSSEKVGSQFIGSHRACQNPVLTLMFGRVVDSCNLSEECPDKAHGGN
ncbi:hypothetical protein AAG570_010029 [Ranatra chinensis]|uniref:Integrase catalytic domain-containing protein n=1 Tax=Ranatra chinensis TaxID=642074 RepID=A0ABD0YLC4_9HEMI